MDDLERERRRRALFDFVVFNWRYCQVSVLVSWPDTANDS